MALAKQTISPCLWFDTEAEDAAKFYVSIFPHAKINDVSYYPDVAQDRRSRAPGSVMVVAFEINGQTFTALNGGPQFKFSEAVSFQVPCETQDEIDYFWARLTEDGGQESPCGWLKDKFGLSWQVFPKAVPQMLMDPDRTKAARVMSAFMQMKKMDLATLQRAHRGE
jgi:predicted 3-demethylubiquinone-9 3-methyltransferase (glyoxalase superfamily)